MEELIDQEKLDKNKKVVKSLKVFSTAMKILSNGCSLIKTPITEGISMVANIGSFVTGAIASGMEVVSDFETDSIPVPAR